MSTQVEMQEPTQKLTFKQRLDAYEKLMRLDKPIGALLLLWPALWGLWFASPLYQRMEIVLIFLVGTVRDERLCRPRY